jgi:hypothetical protein
MGIIKSFLLFVLLSFNLLYSQTVVGKIYTKDEANSIYGTVITSTQISSSLLSGLTNITTNYIMFRINNGNLYILGDQRKPLYPSGIVVDPQTEMRLFSVSLVSKIITDGNNPYTIIEIRKNNVLTITNGNYTLEYSWPCPPQCISN